jgi:glycosyltransferase involved in cell wall biosynthesis
MDSSFQRGLDVSPCEVSVVVPVYRNAETLAELAARVRSALEGRSYELIFVDDLSPDDSRSRAGEIARRDPAIKVIALEERVGQQRAILAGLAVVLGAWTVVLDADLQDPPEAIPKLLARGSEGFDAVFAGRRGEYESRGRIWTSRLYKKVLALVCRLPPGAGLYLALSRRMTDHLRREAEGWILPPVGLAGLPVTSIPVERQRRKVGTTAYTSWRRLHVGLASLTDGVRRRWLV